MVTKRQHEVYTFIKNHIMEHGYAPTIHEIMRTFNVRSPSMVHRHIQALINEGWLEHEPNRSRSLRLSQPTMQQLPILGKIPAGSPMEAVPTEDYFDVTHELGGDNRFLLRVSGDSMIGDNICDGDHVLCQKAQQAPNGTIVVALIDKQEVTLKRIQQKNNAITLVPSNPNYSSVTYKPEQIDIQGVYLGLIRLV